MLKQIDKNHFEKKTEKQEWEGQTLSEIIKSQKAEKFEKLLITHLTLFCSQEKMKAQQTSC